MKPIFKTGGSYGATTFEGNNWGGNQCDNHIN
jgi:hypothetical protein